MQLVIYLKMVTCSECLKCKLGNNKCHMWAQPTANCYLQVLFVDVLKSFILLVYSYTHFQDYVLYILTL